MKNTINGLKLNYIVEWVDVYWNPRKEDYCGEYWNAYIVEGLEDYCKGIKYLKPKDLNVCCPGFRSFKSPDEAVHKLKKELQKMGLSGTLHRITHEEYIKSLNLKEK